MKSMTGYGRAHLIRDNIDIEIEVKSVNARYLDLKINLPRELNFFEIAVRKSVSQYLNRGTVEIRINLNDHREPNLNLNTRNLLKYAEIVRQAQTAIGDTTPLPVTFLLQEPGVLETQSSMSEDPLLATLLNETLNKALDTLRVSLMREAVDIKAVLEASVSTIDKSLTTIGQQIQPFKEELLVNMKGRITELLNAYRIENIEQRIVQELAIYIDKYDVQEEITRLHSHIDIMRTTLNKQNHDDIGKTLNFTLQEMQREANTLGSKFSNTRTFHDVLIIKEEIEKCREIVQNVA